MQDAQVKKITAMANSEDPDEMQLNAAFHPGLHCLLRLKQPSRTKIHNSLENSKMQNRISYLLYAWEDQSECKGLTLSLRKSPFGD